MEVGDACVVASSWDAACEVEYLSSAGAGLSYGDSDADWAVVIVEADYSGA